jgi:hypothetical protein
MTINIVYKATAPNTPFAEDICELQVSFVPQLEGAIWLKSQKYWWATPDDWKVGRKALYEQGIAYLMPSAALIVNAVNNLYSLMDARLGGIQRTNLGIDEATGLQLYDPDILPDPNPENFISPGIQHSARLTDAGLQNLINGTLFGPYGQTEQAKQQLAAILTAIQEIAANSGQDYTEVLAQIAAFLA